jgi:hypothetical protein
MTSYALPSISTVTPIGDSLIQRNRPLALFGAACLALGLASLALQVVDPRTLTSGVGVWVKPAKFFFSVAAFALTAAWFFGYARPERRNTTVMRATAAVLIATGTFELLYICLQAALGMESHFNVTTPFRQTMYNLMGLAAVLLVGTTLPLAWEIARRPAEGLQRSFVAAVVIGLVLTFLLGGGFGGYMGSQLSHSVGAEGGRAALFGWNRLGGDLRVAHFFGIHAEQFIPATAALAAGAAARTRWLVAVVGSAAYSAITVVVFVQAVAGRPFIGSLG